MVYLNRIYTRTGDQGETSLGDGSRVSKTAQRIVAYGAVDELNAALGMAKVVSGGVGRIGEVLSRVQNTLFDLGADLCVPEEGETSGTRLRVTTEQVKWLEETIDEHNGEMGALVSFVLPGGTELGARLHVARTICRRAEIETWRLAEREKINGGVLEYLNRLSDLLFVLSRWANGKGSGDVLWKPGG